MITLAPSLSCRSLNLIFSIFFFFFPQKSLAKIAAIEKDIAKLRSEIAELPAPAPAPAPPSDGKELAALSARLDGLKDAYDELKRSVPPDQRKVG